MKITTVGIDLARNVFQVHAVDERGAVVLRKQLRRDQMTAFFREPAALCDRHGGVRQRPPLGAYPEEPRPRHSADVAAVRQALRQEQQERRRRRRGDLRSGRATQHAIRPVKSVEQQAVLSLHRVRQGFVKARTAQANQIRSLLGEFGLIMPAGISHIAKRVPSLLEDASNSLPGSFRRLIARLTEHLKDLDILVGEFEAQIKAWHRSSELSMKLEKIPGIGPLGASALVASIADANSFANGRQLSAWLGLVPRQHSSGASRRSLASANAATCTALNSLD